MELKFERIEGKSARYRLVTAVLGVLAIAGFVAYAISYLKGFQVWGISDQVIWGQLITVDIYFIGLSAGSLAVSSLVYVFGQEQYKSIGRIAVFMGLLLMIGAMLSVIMDLGRPEKFWRLFMFFYLNNMTSMFAINAIFYSSYIGLLLFYLGSALADNRKLTKAVAPIAIACAVLVHMGTGAVFGFIGTRESFFTPLKPIEFITAAFASGLAMVILVSALVFRLSKRQLDTKMLVSLARWLAICIAVLVVLVLTDKLTHLYPPDREAVLFLTSGPFSWLFWGLQVTLGYVVPLAILFHPRWRKTVSGVLVAAAFNVVGIFGERAALVIPGLAEPFRYYPGTVEGVWGQTGVFPIVPVETIITVGLFAFLALALTLGLKNLALLPADESTAGPTAKPAAGEVPPSNPRA